MCMIIKYILILFIFMFQVTLENPVYCPNNCGRCYKGPGRKGSLFRHLKNECGVQKKFQCSLCLKRFSHKNHLKNHSITIHKKIMA